MSVRYSQIPIGAETHRWSQRTELRGREWLFRKASHPLFIREVFQGIVLADFLAGTAKDAAGEVFTGY